jgi:hypothetical protein
MKEFDVLQLAMAATIHNPDLRLESEMKTGIIKAIFPLDLCSCFLLDLSSFPILTSRVATGLHSIFELPPDATVIWSVAS